MRNTRNWKHTTKNKRQYSRWATGIPAWKAEQGILPDKRKTEFMNDETLMYEEEVS